MTEVLCAYRNCNVMFVPARHNQVYCTPEHCREETNIRLREAYRDAKDRKSGKVRRCKTCPTILSRYNTGKICSKCEREKQSQEAKINWEIFNRGN